MFSYYRKDHLIFDLIIYKIALTAYLGTGPEKMVKIYRKDYQGDIYNLYHIAYMI